MADFVTLMGPTDGATAAGCSKVMVTDVLRTWSPGDGSKLATSPAFRVFRPGHGHSL